MNILKPQKIFINKIRKIENFIEEIKINDCLESVYIEDYMNENIELSNIKIGKAILNNVEVINGNLQDNTFIDIEFNNCNFSN